MADDQTTPASVRTSHIFQGDLWAEIAICLKRTPRALAVTASISMSVLTRALVARKWVIHCFVRAIVAYLGEGLDCGVQIRRAERARLPAGIKRIERARPVAKVPSLARSRGCLVLAVAHKQPRECCRCPTCISIRRSSPGAVQLGDAVLGRRGFGLLR